MNRLFLTSRILAAASSCVLAAGALLLAAPGIASAQSFSMGGTGVSLSASTDNPVPGQVVTITADSNSISLSDATITWTSNGAVIAHGIGADSVSVTAPALGKHVTVAVTAIGPDGSSFSNSMVLGSGDVDLIEETSGYVPPFFLGKVPPAYQNDVTIIAMPHIANSSGVEYDPKTLVYTWQKDGTNLSDQSGYGKQSVTVEGSVVPRDYIVSVSVATRDGSAQGGGLIDVSFQAPTISFYTDDPLYGPLYNLALGSSLYVGAQREIGVIAVPFGFDMTAEGKTGLSYSWLINGTGQENLDDNDSITLRAPDGVAGASSVQVQASSAGNILQAATGAFNAIFSAGSASNAPSNITL